MPIDRDNDEERAERIEQMLRDKLAQPATPAPESEAEPKLERLTRQAKASLPNERRSHVKKKRA